MKRILVIIHILCLLSICGSAQTNFSMKLYAGSNAPWGQSQNVTIDSKGNVKYELSEVNKGVKDSSSFSITRTQLSLLNQVVNQIQFFKLNEFYNKESRDGTRLSVEITDAGKTHRVHWICGRNRQTLPYW